MGETKAETFTATVGSVRHIMLCSYLTDGFTDEPARRHKRKRIQKKWLKRFGYKPKIDGNIYLTEDDKILMHPETFKKFVTAFGSEDAAAAGINKYFEGRKAQ
jgi:hypothetical protein